MKILFVVTELSYFLSHRAALAASLQAEGFSVAVATRYDPDAERDSVELLAKQGIALFNLPRWHRSQISIINDPVTLWQLARIMTQYQPHVVQTVALKPILYTSFLIFCWRILYQLQVCNVAPPACAHLFAGLGFLFTETTAVSRAPWRRCLVVFLLKLLLKQPRTHVVAQNEDDIKDLQTMVGVADEACVLIPGSGIDIDHYAPAELPLQPPLVATFIGRLLWDKGVGDLAAAGKILKDRGSAVKIRVYGMFDAANPSAIEAETMQKWHDLGFIEWMGPCADVAKAYHQSHLAVLLSYREGLPKSLLEAAACGRAMIAADVPGCRSVVRPGETGALITPGDPQALADLLMQWQKDPVSWAKFGPKARDYAGEHFSDFVIHKRFIDLYRRITE